MVLETKLWTPLELDLLEYYTLKNQSPLSQLLTPTHSLKFCMESTPPFIRFIAHKQYFALHDRDHLKEETAYWHTAANQGLQADFKGKKVGRRHPIICGILRLPESALYVEFLHQFVYRVQRPNDAIRDFGGTMNFESHTQCILDEKN